MSPGLRASVVLVSVGTVLSIACLLETTALTMTAFFSAGLPAYAVAGLLYVREVVRDLRRHRVL